MKKAIAFLLVAMMMIAATASIAMAAVKTVEYDAAYMKEAFKNAYKVVIFTGSKKIPVYDFPNKKAKVIGYVEPDDTLGYLEWWSDNKYIRALYGGGDKCGWMLVSDLKGK